MTRTKWRVVLDSSGKAVAAGWCDMNPADYGPGHTVEEHDGPVESRVAELRAKNESMRSSRQSFIDSAKAKIKASANLTDDEVRALFG